MWFFWTCSRTYSYRGIAENLAGEIIKSIPSQSCRTKCKCKTPNESNDPTAWSTFCHTGSVAYRGDDQRLPCHFTQKLKDTAAGKLSLQASMLSNREWILRVKKETKSRGGGGGKNKARHPNTVQTAVKAETNTTSSVDEIRAYSAIGAHSQICILFKNVQVCPGSRSFLATVFQKRLGVLDLAWTNLKKSSAFPTYSRASKWFAFTTYPLLMGFQTCTWTSRSPDPLGLIPDADLC
ncbi:hypothetical protein BDP27DRAFT_1039864 [Rhodocollybia butyracea]|uniref:Uncharacterized protein n=1 Tax=Rhodocollybia butyracea TaxID=206335 RepID=A0A9P5UER4_9AGAR|nr:hypothetical protein BDP27DRAFT_1039864 [Rhodocollybia butyracea]